jgi:cbb3-type cytochrome oxidase maturation protein
MNVIVILIIASLGLALLFLGSFVWAVRSGQFDDTHTPSVRVLLEENKQETGDAWAEGTLITRLETTDNNENNGNTHSS